MRMLRFILLRLFGMLVVLLVIAAVTYAVFYLLPTNPAQLSCGKPCTPDNLERAKEFMGTNLPWWQQLWDFLAGIVAGRTFGSGDAAVVCAAPCFGYSFQQNASVTDLILSRFPVTASIAVGAAILWLLIGVVGGVISALKRGTAIDRTVMTLAIAGASAPSYLVGLLAILVFGFILQWLPTGGYIPFTEDPVQWFLHLLLPWFTLAFITAAVYARLTRGQMIEAMSEDYVRTARAKGLREPRVVLAHGLRTGRTEEADAARRVIDFITASLSPSGTFWGVWYRDHGWTQSWTELKRGLHSRTLAEATLFLLRAQALDPHPQWEHAIRSNLDVVVGRQRADGNLGSVHHAETGEVLSWSGASGLTWIAALVESADRDEGYLPAAVAAGRYYEQFVDREFLHGAPEDVDLAPTSEDGYAAVMAYVALHRATGDAHWLDVARRAADWMLTFRYSYDVAFPEHTLLGAYAFRTRGADTASPSNQHLHAYGLVCTAELRELSEALGDPYYSERADETLACFRQFIAREDGDFNAYRGMVSERYYQTACFQPKGMLLTLSHAWSVGVALLACEQTLAGDPAAVRQVLD